MDIAQIAMAVALVAVLAVLLAGIVNLTRTGPEARSRSNKLMRLRVLVQFVAVIVLMAGLWWRTQGGG